MQACVHMQEAMLAFKRLSHAQYATGWVLCCIGRAFFEMVDYAQAAVAFEWAQQVDPHRLEVRVRQCLGEMRRVCKGPTVLEGRGGRGGVCGCAWGMSWM